MSHAATPAMPRAEARTTIWMLLPHHVRRLVLWSASMPVERAADELTAFTAVERAAITSALRSMMTHLSVAEQCMNDSDVTTRTITVLH